MMVRGSGKSQPLLGSVANRRGFSAVREKVVGFAVRIGYHRHDGVILFP
jgi:hypothetical protein